MLGKRETREDYLKLFSNPPRSFLAQYPDIPPPLPPHAPELLAARWITHDLRCEQWPSMAADLLEAGYDSPSLRILAGICVASSSDIEPLVLRVFRELNVRYPIPEPEAHHLFARELAREGLSGTRNIWRVARDLAALARLADWTDALLNDVDECVDSIDCDPQWRPSIAQLNSDLLDLLRKIARRDPSDSS